MSNESNPHRQFMKPGTVHPEHDFNPPNDNPGTPHDQLAFDPAKLNPNISNQPTEILPDTEGNPYATVTMPTEKINKP